MLLESEYIRHVGMPSNFSFSSLSCLFFHSAEASFFEGNKRPQYEEPRFSH